MNLRRNIQQLGLTMPVLALAVASALCVAMVAYRIVVGCQVRHAYLVWNLFLAWLPLVFALLATQQFSPGGHWRDRRFLALGGAWLLFLPNAPYIFTDLVHVLGVWRQGFWTELMLVLLCALTGFLAGFLSLQLMHGLVARVWGRWAGWGFVAAVSGLSAFGVYLGRFLRLNSWNVLTHPLHVVESTGLAAWTVMTQWQHTKFLILFSLFLLLGYVMLFAISQPARVGASGPAVRGGIGSP